MKERSAELELIRLYLELVRTADISGLLHFRPMERTCYNHDAQSSIANTSVPCTGYRIHRWEG